MYLSFFWLAPFKARSGIFMLLFCLLPLTTLAQERASIPARPGDTVIWYVVLPGDTLSKITEKHLGEKTLWPENHRLNPHVRDPDLLKIGSRLRIIAARELPVSKAEVEKVVRKVMRRSPRQSDWQDAEKGDVLSEKNEVQTYKRASTRLRFEDGAHLDIKEESLVFLRQVGQTLRGVERQSIEIRSGEAEITQTAKRAKRSDIEIIVGDVFAKPVPDASGMLATRTRRSKDGQARVMVYGGKTEVDAAGAKVDVPKGMGTFVDPGEAPAPPRKLLAATRLASPPPSSAFAFTNPLFKWKAVKDAKSYIFELCNDEDCAAITFRQDQLTTTAYQSETLPQGSHYWRVTAVSAENLDGFPSKTRLFKINGDRPDLLPPIMVAVVVGSGKVTASDKITLGPGGQIRIHAVDDAAGMGIIEYRWGNSSWKRYNGEALTPPNGSTALRLQARTKDLLDKPAEELDIEVVFETTAPAAPTIQKDP